jgi:hypothetical protein
LWRQVEAVKSCGPDRLTRVAVRLAHSPHALDRGVATFGAVLDVVQGRRNWFGLRPRAQPQWLALGRDWQELFSRSAIGVFHAPAWTEPGDLPDGEACAAADAFMAVQSGMAGRVKILYTQAQFGR